MGQAENAARRKAITERGEAGHGISHEDMAFLVAYDAAQGTPAKFLGVSPRQGITDPFVTMANTKVLLDRLEQGAAQGFFLEAISAQALLMEMMIREWLEVWRRRRWTPQERQTFGQLVAEAKNKGFDAALCARLTQFNQRRNAAIHGLLRSTVVYNHLREIFVTDPKLIADVHRFVDESRPRLGEVGFGPDGEIYDLEGRLLNDV